MAQLGARLNRTQEVRGSNPLSSTIRKPFVKSQLFTNGFCFLLFAFCYIQVVAWSISCTPVATIFRFKSLMSSSTNPMRLLFIDDDSEQAKAVLTPLQSANLTCRHLATDKFRPEMLESFNLHMVLLHLTLPEMGSAALCRQIRALSKAPIVILSQRTRREDLFHFLNQGADDFIPIRTLDSTLMMVRILTLLRRAYEYEPARYARAHAEQPECATTNSPGLADLRIVQLYGAKPSLRARRCAESARAALPQLQPFQQPHFPSLNHKKRPASTCRAFCTSVSQRPGGRRGLLFCGTPSKGSGAASNCVNIR